MAGVVLLLLPFAAAGVFVTAVVYRFVRISRLPMHLRWELYPVAHEKGRASYGGSYLEEMDWWTKPRQSSLLGELKVMVPEILLLAGVWEHNRRHWLRTFPFHFGLYLLTGATVLLLIGGVATAAGANISADGNWAGRSLHHATWVIGYAGLVLALLGALGLLLRRTFNPDYRDYTRKSDYFNLVFFVVTFGVALLARAFADPAFEGLRGYLAGVVSLDASFAGGANAGTTPLLAGEIVLVCLLLAYVPLTHMSHFFTKWFTYHSIRWSDEPSVVGGRIEAKAAEALHYPVSWSAPHIRGDGKKNWAEVATAPVEEQENDK